MATVPIDTVVRHLRRAVSRQGAAGRTDGQLLASFIEQKDEAAFEALVQRHGPMVWGVCRRVVGHHQDAEDAFQATFLILARKASAVRPRARVANWLHGVALRTALKAKAVTAKRRQREKQVTEMPEPEAVRQEPWLDTQPLLDQELNGLPANYRLPILLCDLDGKTIKEAAQQLGWPQGTLAGRLARGRKLLAKRLTNRGVALSAGSLAAVLSENVASAGVPVALVNSTVQTAARVAAGQAMVAGLVPAKVVALMEGVLTGMMLTKLSKAAAGLVVLGVVAFGGGLLTHGAAGQQTKRERDGDQPAVSQPAPLKRDAEAVAADGAKRDTPKTDLDRLQGVWSAVSIEQGGGKPSRLDKAIFFMVDGKRACWQSSDWEMQGGLYLDPTRKPKTYDLATSTKTIEGIYALDGDTLRLCYDLVPEAKRPARFVTEKGSQQVLIVLKRTHGPEVFPFRLPDGTRTFPTFTDNAMTTPPTFAPRPTDSKATPYYKPTQKDKDALPGTWSYTGRSWQGNVTEQLLRKYPEEKGGRVTFSPGECAWEGGTAEDTSRSPKLSYTLETINGSKSIVCQLKNPDPRWPPIPKHALTYQYMIQGDKLTLSMLVHPVARPGDPPAYNDPGAVWLHYYFKREVPSARTPK